MEDICLHMEYNCYLNIVVILELNSFQSDEIFWHFICFRLCFRFVSLAQRKTGSRPCSRWMKAADVIGFWVSCVSHQCLVLEDLEKGFSSALSHVSSFCSNAQ